MIKLSIKPEKIRDVIGKGGSVIKKLIEETGAQIDITDDGICYNFKCFTKLSSTC